MGRASSRKWAVRQARYAMASVGERARLRRLFGQRAGFWRGVARAFFRGAR